MDFRGHKISIHCLPAFIELMLAAAINNNWFAMFNFVDNQLCDGVGVYCWGVSARDCKESRVWVALPASIEFDTKIGWAVALLSTRRD